VVKQKGCDLSVITDKILTLADAAEEFQSQIPVESWCYDSSSLRNEARETRVPILTNIPSQQQYDRKKLKYKNKKPNTSFIITYRNYCAQETEENNQKIYSNFGILKR